MNNENKDDQDFMDPHQETQYFLDKLNSARQGMGNRDRPYILWLPELEDDTRVREFEYGTLKDGIPTLSQSLTDGENGLYVLGGLPNAGKSTLITNMEINSLKLNPELMIVDLSFDDDIKKRYQQWIAALTGLRYQEITTKMDLPEAKLLRRAQADTWLDEMIKKDRLRIYDGDYPILNDRGQIVRMVNMRKPENIMTLMRKVRKQYPERKIWFFIDAWNDLDISGSKYSSGLEESNSTVNAFKAESHNSNIGVFMSSHLRKLMGRRSSLEDLKGTSGLGYAAVWAGIFRNELRENAVNDPLVYEDENGRLWPVGIVDVVKNKVGACDLPLLYQLMADRCGIGYFTPEEYTELYETWTGRSLR